MHWKTYDQLRRRDRELKQAWRATVSDWLEARQRADELQRPRRDTWPRRG
jgi:hypothetical protein